MSGTDTRTVLFDSTNAALWAEEVAVEGGIPVEAVPAPADSDAKCDIALRTLATYLQALEAALAAEGVPYRLWHGREASGAARSESGR